MARYVADKWGTPLLTEVARAVMAEEEADIVSIRHDIKRVDAYQKKIFERQVSEERKHQAFVADRSFDNLAYACEYTTCFREILGRKELAEYVESLRLNEAIIFFIRPSSETLVDDGVREKTTWDGILRIDSYVKFMLEMWGLRYFTIATHIMQERIRLVEGVLRLVGMDPRLPITDLPDRPDGDPVLPGQRRETDAET